MPREARKTLNQALFREVNERIADLANGFARSTAEFICECADVGCAERVEVPLSDYHVVRDDERSFLVVPGHEDAVDEDVIARAENFLIVRTRTPTTARRAAEQRGRVAGTARGS